MKRTNTYLSTIHHLNNITCYTWLIGYVDLNRDAWYPVASLAPCQSQTIPEPMSELLLWLTFIAAGIVWLCQSALVRAMFIRATIVRELRRDLLRDHLRATHVLATLVQATLDRAILVMAKLLSYIIYFFFHKMKDSLDPKFNPEDAKGVVRSTQSSLKPKRAGIHLSQPVLLDLIIAHLPEPCWSELKLSKTM